MGRKKGVKRNTHYSFLCPCCDHIAFEESGAFEICPICLWKDDGLDIDKPYAKSVENDNITLAQARKNFAKFGSCVEQCKNKVTVPANTKLFPRLRRDNIFCIFQFLESLRGLGVGISEHACGLPDCELDFGLESMATADDKRGFVICAFNPAGVNKYATLNNFSLSSKLTELSSFRQLVLDCASKHELLLEQESFTSEDSWRQLHFKIFEND